MAISKVIYKSDPSDSGTVWMDVTQKTVTAGSMLNGVTALKNDGTGITGNIASKSSSDLTASGSTVTAPAGYYASSASKSVASGSVSTPATTITANPTISVSSGGLITASVSGSKSVTPTVSAGYVSSGTAGTITVSGSNTSQLTTQAAQTIHPSTTDQTIASGKYLTGAQTVKGVLLTNLSAGNIKKDVVVKVGDSTDDDCVTSVTGTYEGGGGSGLEYETGTWTPVSDASSYDISFSNTHSTAPVMYEIIDATGTYDNTTNSSYRVSGVNFEQLFGAEMYYSETMKWYCRLDYVYRGSSASAFSTSGNSGTNSSEWSYFATSTSISAFTGSSRYWRSGRTYKWIAIWAPTT